MEYAIGKMDEGPTTLSKDTSSNPLPKKIVRAKPADLTDSCWTATGEKIVEPRTYSGGQCNELYPTAPSLRMVARETLRGNSILKCQLKPINRAGYKVAISADRMVRLKTIFPQGVCGYLKPGVEQQPPAIGAWHSFQRVPPNAVYSRRSGVAKPAPLFNCDAHSIPEEQRRKPIEVLAPVLPLM